MGITRLTISNHSEPTPRTNKAKPLTWGQLKKLTTEREKLVKEQRQPLTSATLFLVMLSVVITMVGANHTYWAYVPNPPLSSVQFSRSVVSNSSRSHESQHARPPCPSPTPGVHPDSHPSSQRCRPAISSSVVSFSSCPQSLPASESFPMSQLFA